jgi:hypothetical protein
LVWKIEKIWKSIIHFEQFFSGARLQDASDALRRNWWVFWKMAQINHLHLIHRIAGKSSKIIFSKRDSFTKIYKRDAFFK